MQNSTLPSPPPPPSVFQHALAILVLPFTVTIIVPYLLLSPGLKIHNNPITLAFSAFFFLLGGTLFVTTLQLFHFKGKGTLAPWQPTKRLVVSGPYLYCRNPMITGVLFLLLGESFLFYSTRLLVWAGCFFLINTVYFLIKEEPDLEKRFGEDYRRYKQLAPRWIPRLRPIRWDEKEADT